VTELRVPRRWLLVRDFVAAEVGAAACGFVVAQPLWPRIELAQNSVRIGAREPPNGISCRWHRAPAIGRDRRDCS
jgi:hypothetical protein